MTGNVSGTLHNESVGAKLRLSLLCRLISNYASKCIRSEPIPMSESPKIRYKSHYKLRTNAENISKLSGWNKVELICFFDSKCICRTSPVPIQFRCRWKMNESFWDARRSPTHPLTWLWNHVRISLWYKHKGTAARYYLKYKLSHTRFVF